MSNIELKGLKGLHGLDSLLYEVKVKPTKESLFDLPIQSLVPGKYQPRSSMDDEALQALAASIKIDGVIQPLIVRQLKADKYEIIAGERRWKASKMAGLSTVPAIIRAVPDETALAFALIENIQRESLNPIDEAMSLVKLRDEFGMTHDDIAVRVGRSRSTVSNLMRLLSLNENIKELLQSKKLEMGHARALLSLSDEKQTKAAEVVISKSLSVRETERLVQKINTAIEENIFFCDANFEEKMLRWKTILSKQLPSKVGLHFNADGKGRLVIHFSSKEEADWLIGNLNIKNNS